MVMLVIMIVIVVMIMMMIVVVIMLLEKIRVERQDAVEVESAAVEHPVERNGAALGPMDDRVRIDGADAALDVAELVGADEVGLVEKDDVGKADLLLGLGRVAEP